VTTEPARQQNSAVAERERKARGAFRYYRVMAFVTGGMLLLLCAEMVMKYVLHLNGDEPVLGTWVAIVHGWIYVIYLATVFNLWSIMRWDLGRVVVLIAGGVVPILSFVMERRAERWFTAGLPGILERVAALQERRARGA